jgi:hypothetical protein
VSSPATSDEQEDNKSLSDVTSTGDPVEVSKSMDELMLDFSRLNMDEDDEAIFAGEGQGPVIDQPQTPSAISVAAKSYARSPYPKRDRRPPDWYTCNQMVKDPPVILPYHGMTVSMEEMAHLWRLAAIT